MGVACADSTSPARGNYQDDDKRQQAVEFWAGIVQAGGDEGTDDSLLKRIRMLEKAKMWDPRD